MQRATDEAQDRADIAHLSQAAQSEHFEERPLRGNGFREETLVPAQPIVKTISEARRGT